MAGDIAKLHQVWKRCKLGGYRSEIEIILPLKEYDIRRKRMTGRELKRFQFKGSLPNASHRKENRIVPFSDGEKIGLDVKRAYLELRWERQQQDYYNWFCHYELFIPKLDGGTICTALGGTNRQSDAEPIDGDTVDTPFRDHSHAIWDSELLGVKAWAVYGPLKTEVLPTQKVEVAQA